MGFEADVETRAAHESSRRSGRRASFAWLACDSLYRTWEPCRRFGFRSPTLSLLRIGTTEGLLEELQRNSSRRLAVKKAAGCPKQPAAITGVRPTKGRPID